MPNKCKTSVEVDGQRKQGSQNPERLPGLNRWETRVCTTKNAMDWNGRPPEGEGLNRGVSANGQTWVYDGHLHKALAEGRLSKEVMK